MRAIFLSYRRDDAEGQAGRLFDDLTRHFGEDTVFMDVAAIDAGRDFRRAIDEQVASCGVLLAIIGKSWLTATDGSGGRRLDDPKDFVRLETASALKRDIPVVPVLVHGARMPRVEDLPEDLKDLAFRNGVELTHARWDSDVEVLVKALRSYVQTTQVPTDPRPQSAPSEQGQSRPGLSRMIIAILVGVLGVAIGGYFWYQKSADVNAREKVSEEKSRAATAGEEEAKKAEPEGMKTDEAEPSPSSTRPEAPSDTSIEAPPEGYYRLLLKQNKHYIDAAYCTTRLVLSPAASDYAEGACELFRFVPAGGGWSRLQMMSGGNFLSAATCSTEVSLAEISGTEQGACQLWRLVPAGDGWSRLQLKHGQGYLDGCSPEISVGPESDVEGGACQLWGLVPK